MPGDGSTHWSSRKLAAELGGLSPMTVTRIWAKHALKPHRLEGYLPSNDPDFEAKAADVIGLYLHPPQHAHGKEIHVIADNLSAHRTARVQAFLAQYPRVRLHFTPTYSSWLTQIELWFAKIERDVIARGVIPSVPDPKRKLMRHIRHYTAQTREVEVLRCVTSNHSRINRYSPLAVGRARVASLPSGCRHPVAVDPPWVEPLWQLIQQHPRFGYRHLWAVPSGEHEGRVSGAPAEEVVGASAVVYPATTRAGLDQPSQPQ